MIETTWGYTLTTATSLTDLVTTAEFDNLTGGKFAGDIRVASSIPSASRSIQNYCGWHIYPNLECEMVYRVLDLRDCFVGRDLLIQLPATHVTQIKSILLNAKFVDGAWQGDEATDYDLERSGLLRIYDVCIADRRSKLRVVYDAGLNANQIDVLKEIAVNRVTHAVTNAYGITSEAAGGVSVSYSTASANGAAVGSLPDHDREVLGAYRVKGVF